jgi:hypothetical protein
MSQLTNLRSFLDRVNQVGENSLIRTRSALDQVEANTFTLAQAYMNALLGIEDLFAAFAPLPFTAIFLPPLSLTVPHASTGTATQTLQLGATGSTTATIIGLQPLASNPPNLQLVIPPTTVSATLTTQGLLSVTITNLGGVLGTIPGPWPPPSPYPLPCWQGVVVGATFPLAQVSLVAT